MSDHLKAPLSLPTGKYEFNDGNNWFSLASENWVLNNLNKISPCTVATTANLNATYANGSAGVGATLINAATGSNITPLTTIDGYTSLALNQRVLVKDQTTNTQNGIYIITDLGTNVNPWKLTRASDFDSVSQMIAGTAINVINGTTNGVTGWMLNSAVTTVGTSPLTFALLSKSPVGDITNILPVSNQTTVSITNGVATIGLSNNTVIPGNASLTLPVGTTAQRPTTATAGMIRWNTSLTN